MSEVKFIRNEETGKVEAYKDGKKIGEVKTMGDDVSQDNDTTKRKDTEGSKKKSLSMLEASI